MMMIITLTLLTWPMALLACLLPGWEDVSVVPAAAAARAQVRGVGGRERLGRHRRALARLRRPPGVTITLMMMRRRRALPLGAADGGGRVVGVGVGGPRQRYLGRGSGGQFPLRLARPWC